MAKPLKSEIICTRCIVHLIRNNSFILFACPSVCLYSINAKMTEPSGPNFYMATHVTLGKVYEHVKVEQICSEKYLSFLKKEKSTKGIKSLPSTKIF